MSNIKYPMTKLEFTENLSTYHQQISWLRALLIAIQSDEDVEPGFHVYYLTQIGEDLARTWLIDIEEIRENAM